MVKPLVPRRRVAWIAPPRLLAVVLGALWSFGLCLGLPLGPLQLGGVAHAQAKTRGQAKALVVRRLTLVKQQDLSFGSILARAQAGTVSVNAFTNARTATGGVALVGGTAHAARFVGAGTPRGLAMVSWRVAPPYTLRRVGGLATADQTMTVDQLTANAVQFNGAGWDFLQIPANGFLDIRIGGRLQVKANQMPGDYEGTFDITLDYY